MPVTQVVKWESPQSERRLQLHEDLRNGDIVDVFDTWQDNSYPGSILSTAAFTQVRRALAAAAGGRSYFA